jgi:ABC-2 type transport system permease protein
MQKYLQVFKISFHQEFAYRLSFVMWRVRNVLQIFVVFFLWDTIFSHQEGELFGYDRDKILTYVFGLIFIKAIVLSSRTQDVAGEIARGEIINYLLRPINYFRYWLTRDISSKVLNISFAVGEFILLYIILKPPFFFQGNFFQIFLFLISICLAMFTYFLLLFIVNAIHFWAPELGWGGHFLFTVIMVEFLSGVLFPLDILPANIQNIINFTPFPYLIFFPIQIYLGKVSGLLAFKGLLISASWIIILWLLMKSIWAKGFKAYQAYGR